jgi:type III secretory pathway component EscU
MQCCLHSSDFIQFLSSTEVLAKATYFLSQQHQQLESCLWLMLGPEGKVSTPFDFAEAIAGHLTASSFANLLDCLIDFALTVPETAQLSSEEIFVGCCLLATEKVNSESLSALLVGSFGGAMGKGGQLTELMKELFLTINPDL